MTNAIQVTDNVTLKVEKFEKLTELAKNYLNEFINTYKEITEHLSLEDDERESAFWIMCVNSMIEGACKTDDMKEDEETQENLRDFGKELLTKIIIEGFDVF